VRIVAVHDLQGQQWPGMNGIARGEALARIELRVVSPGSIALAKTRSGTRAEGVPSMHALQLSLKRLSSLPAALALSCACGCQPLEPKVPEEAPAAAELNTPPQTPPQSPHADEKQEARERAEAWLSLVDQGEYAESWEAAAKLFQASTAKDQWATALQGARTPLGQSSSRNLRAAEYKTQL
jgi:hypothetical protein